MTGEQLPQGKRNHHIGLILFLVILIILLIVLGMSIRKFSSKQLNPVVETSKPVSKAATSSSVHDGIGGAYRDDRDGAAIVLNEDGTGQYVYADKVNSDTNDKLTWRIEGDQYLVTLQDKDVVNPLTLKVHGNEITLSGNRGWNQETFTKVNGQLNLNEFLQQAHGRN